MERTFGVVLLATSMAATAAWHITDGGRSSQPVRSSVSRSSTSAPTVDRGALTADGDRRVRLRRLSLGPRRQDARLTKVAPSWQRATQPRFSPNGSWLSYLVSSGQVWLRDPTAALLA